MVPMFSTWNTFLLPRNQALISPLTTASFVDAAFFFWFLGFFLEKWIHQAQITFNNLFFHIEANTFSFIQPEILTAITVKA